MDTTTPNARRGHAESGRVGPEGVAPAAVERRPYQPGRKASGRAAPERTVPDRTARAALLEQTRLARGMDWRSLLVLGQSMTYREVSAGSFLYQEGEPGEELAVLLSGVLTVVKRDSEGQDARVGEIHARAVVGEMSLLDGGPRSASVYAQTPAALLALNRRALERLLEAHPRVGTRLLAALAAEVSQRLRLATGRLARRGGGDAFALEDV